MVSKHIILGVCLLSSIWNLGGNGINFGSKTASLVVKDNAAFVIGSSKPMNIESGTFANEGSGLVSGNSINFNRGVFNFFNSVSDLNGSIVSTFDQNVVQLGQKEDVSGGTMIANPGGLSSVRVDGLPGRNILRGQPLFFGNSDIRLKDVSSALAIAVQNTVNTNILLNGGVLFLQDDLRLGNDAVILDSGTVQLNNRRFSLGGSASTWSGVVLWDGAQDLQINSAVSLDGKWVFLGDGQINGNGNVIDISAGGSIVVLAGATLRLSGVQIKGLGSSGTIKIAPDATLILTDVSIEMDSDYTIDSGTVFVEGSSTVITKDHILRFADGADGNNGKLIVDRVVLTYETGAFLDRQNIQPSLINDPTRTYVDVLGQGEIRTIRGDTLTFRNYRTDSLLQKYAIVAPYRKFQIFPEITAADTLNYNVLVDGNSNFLGFTRTYEPVFIVSKNVHATLQRVIMRDVSPKHIEIQEDASLVFGDQTTVSLARNEVLDYEWVFSGETILKGAGNILEFSGDGAIVLRGQNASLLIDGIILKGVKALNIRCEDPSSTITLKNVKWLQSDNFIYNQGALNILDDVTFVGGLTPDQSQNFKFSYQSTQPLSVLANSTMLLMRDMIFEYAPTNDNNNLFVLTSPSAALSLTQATLLLISPMTLATGRLVVRETNFVQGALTQDDSLTLDQPTGAMLGEL